MATPDVYLASEGSSIYNPDMPDQVVLFSVGIDVGSATSHFIISRITLRRLGKALLSRYVVIDRAIVYESPVSLTPYQADGLIDAGALQEFLERNFAEAGMSADDVDTGAVILTGEALRRANARSIGNLFERHAGKFVCATAGDLYEVAMAAHGSGAVELSRRSGRILNIDIGGGTTKVSVSEGGQIVSKGVLHVGARLVATDQDDRIVRCETALDPVLRDLDIRVYQSDRLTRPEKQRVADRLVECVSSFLGIRESDAVSQALSITESPEIGHIDEVVFSSGLSEYLYGREDRDFGDLAYMMASAIRKHLDSGYWPWKVHAVTTGIRATVAGVSQFSLQMSGDTVYVSHPETLPWRNLPLVTVDATSGNVEEIAKAMHKARLSLGIDTGSDGMAWYFRVDDSREYADLRILADGIAEGLKLSVGVGTSNVLMFVNDLAGTVGYILGEEIRTSMQIVSVDCIQADAVDFVDVAEIVEPNGVVPIMVKALIY